MVLELQPANPMQRMLAAQARSRFEAMIRQRWQLIDHVRSQISRPFYLVLVLWLLAIFASFGLSAPRNMLVYVTILLCALSVTSAVFIIMELSTPLGGLIVVSSEPMRDALAHLGQG